jgi:hypothetical protein
MSRKAETLKAEMLKFAGGTPAATEDPFICVIWFNKRIDREGEARLG